MTPLEPHAQETVEGPVPGLLCQPPAHTVPGVGSCPMWCGTWNAGDPLSFPWSPAAWGTLHGKDIMRAVPGLP